MILSVEKRYGLRKGKEMELVSEGQAVLEGIMLKKLTPSRPLSDERIRENGEIDI